MPSALLASLEREPGHERVADALTSGCAISTVNLSDVVAKLCDANALETIIRRALNGLLARGLEVVPFDEALAFAAGFLRPVRPELGLSLGARACLALGHSRQQLILTADRGWAEVAHEVGVEVRISR